MISRNKYLSQLINNKKRLILVFKSRARPDFSRGFYVSSCKLVKVIFTRPNIVKNAQK